MASLNHNNLINNELEQGGRTPNLLIQLFRYFIVGGIAFAADFGILALLTDFYGISYLISATISFIAGLTVNYFLSIVWVFNAIKGTKFTKFIEFVLFCFVGVIGLGLNILIMWTLTEKAQFHYLFSKIISTIIVFAWNFLARRFVVSKIQNSICIVIQTNK